MNDAGDRAGEVVLAAVAGTGLLPAGEPVVVMLSGGRDSVCLLDVAVELAGRDAVQALHVNYGLRHDAAEDERHCRELCLRSGVELHVERAERGRDAGNLQAWARDVRYAAARRLAEGQRAKIATGHTASDQAETVLYRLASSPSRRALLGMAPRDGDVIRPLLGVTRDQTAAYCRARGLAWREDASNEGDAFARNRVRAGLVPALRDIHPAAEENVVRAAEVLRAEAAVLDETVDALLAGRSDVSLDELRGTSPALARLVVTRLAEEAAGRLVPRAAARTDDILGLGDDAALDIGEGTRARVTKGVLRFERTPALPPTPAARTRFREVWEASQTLPINERIRSVLRDEVMKELFSEDVVWDLSDMGGGRYFGQNEFRGYAGMRSFWTQWGEAWEDIKTRVLEWHEAKRHTVIWVDQTVRGRTSGLEMAQQPYAWVIEWEGDFISRVTFLRDREAALRAGGIPS
jgi:tRNA(Ile)-lysidine synthase